MLTIKLWATNILAKIKQSHPDHDPTPWCTACGARTQERCNCGPIDPMD
jgi:hypothetical protein